MSNLERDEGPPIDWRESVRAKALGLGFSAAGFTSADPLEPAIQRRWKRWLATDRAGRMDYLRRERPRRTHPRDLLPEARSAIVVTAGYHDGDHVDPPRDGAGRPTAGKIARYAWGRDYHGVLRGRLMQLGQWIEARAAERGFGGTVSWRAFSDSAPLDERSLAVRAGLGFTGKNTLLLDPEHGSWMLLGVLLISIPFPPDDPMRGESCGSCRRCVEACPTDALSDAYHLDPHRCISYLTIEQPDPIPEEISSRMEGWVFGCDICQEVCPINDRPLARRLPELSAAEGIGPFLSREEVARFASNKAFLRGWGHTPLERPGLKGIKRNLDAALGPTSNDP